MHKLVHSVCTIMFFFHFFFTIMTHHVFSYEAGERLEPFYTGGDVILSSDARLLYTSCDSSVKAVNVETGQTTLSLSEVLTLR